MHVFRKVLLSVTNIELFSLYIRLYPYAFCQPAVRTSVWGTTVFPGHLRSFVSPGVFTMHLPVLGCLSRSVFVWATRLCALPIMYHFVSVLWLLSSEREIPLPSVWTHCFQTLPALGCCVSHPMRTSFRRGGLTSWPGIGWPRLGGACGKEGLQLTATEFRLSLLHHLKVKFSSHSRRLAEYNKQGRTENSLHGPLFLMMRWRSRGHSVLPDVLGVTVHEEDKQS